MTFWGKSIETPYGLLSVGKELTPEGRMECRTLEGLSFGLGYKDSLINREGVHQWMALGQGRLAQFDPKYPGALELDRWVRFWNLPHHVEGIRESLSRETHDLFLAYVQGFNQGVASKGWGKGTFPRMTLDDQIQMILLSLVWDWWDRHWSTQQFLVEVARSTGADSRFFELFPDADALCPHWATMMDGAKTPVLHTDPPCPPASLPRWRASSQLKVPGAFAALHTMVLPSKGRPLERWVLQSPQSSLVIDQIPGLPLGLLASNGQRTWSALLNTANCFKVEILNMEGQETENRLEEFYLGKKWAQSVEYPHCFENLLGEDSRTGISLRFESEILQQGFQTLLHPWRNLEPLHQTAEPWCWGSWLKSEEVTEVSLVTQESQGPHYYQQTLRRELATRPQWSTASLKSLLTDTTSLQAQKILSVVRHHLPDWEPRALSLKRWDYRMEGELAGLFEKLYLSLIHKVFTSGLNGAEYWRDWNGLSAFFNENHGRFDQILLSPGSDWFKDQDKDAMTSEAVKDFLKGPKGITSELGIHRSMGMRSWLEQYSLVLQKVGTCSALIHAEGKILWLTAP